LIDLDAKAATKFISEKGLRYDLTVPFARYVVMHRNEITFPFKRYQMQPVWRADRPQKGRYREFWQCDADVVGSDSLLNELDLIQIYDEAFTQLGIKNYEIKINNRKVLAGIAEVVKSIDVMNTIAVAIDKLDKIGEDGVRKELLEQGFSETELNILFDIITIKGENKEILNQLKGKLQSSQEGLKGIEELAFILASNPNPNINLTLDFSLARGLSYYTGCIFEVVSNDGSLKSSIGGGGRYDNLTGIFGLPNVSGVGISFGLDRIYDVMEELNLFPEQLRATSTQVIFCHFDEATQLYCLPALKLLRDAGIAAEIFPDNKKLGKQLEYANALQIPFAAIAGETEMQQQVFTVKNLITGEQQSCSTQALISLVGQ
jgi:histidyl-tRNA synthetase